MIWSHCGALLTPARGIHGQTPGARFPIDKLARNVHQKKLPAHVGNATGSRSLRLGFPDLLQYRLNVYDERHPSTVTGAVESCDRDSGPDQSTDRLKFTPWSS